MKTISKSVLYFIFIVGLALSVFKSARACSVCLCGDDMYLYGHEYKLERGQFSFSLENRFFTKSSGEVGHGEEELTVSSKNFNHRMASAVQHLEGEGEKLREIRPVLTLTYGATEHLLISASAASSFKRLESVSESGSETINTSGLGDLQIGAMWSRKIMTGISSSYSLGLLFSVKVPTGENNKMSDGERLEEHVQPGSGSWDFKGGIGLTRFGDRHSIFASVFYRANGTNEYDYHFGNAFLYNFGGSVAVAGQVSLTAEINGRYAERDKEADEELSNTGGWVLYLAPGIRYQILPYIGIVSSVQIPTFNDLNDEQDEGAVLNFSVRYDLL